MSLLDALDKPMVEPVALLNLLECRTLWSCCGYHYQDEPEGKSHMLGNTQILMVADHRSFEIVNRLFNENPEFCAYPKWSALLDVKPRQGAVMNLMFGFPVRKEECWFNPNSAHFHEGPVLAIASLCDALRKLEGEMLDEITLVDQNAVMKARTRGLWDFEPSENWVIRKSDYFDTQKVEVVANIEIPPMEEGEAAALWQDEGGEG